MNLEQNSEGAGAHGFQPQLQSQGGSHRTLLRPVLQTLEPPLSQSVLSVKVKVKVLSRVGLFATPWTVTYRAPPSIEFSRQEYWSGLPFLSPKKVKVAQSCPTLCDPTDYTVHGILQARILEWVAFPFSRVSSQPRD